MAGEDLGSAKLILTADDRDLSEKLRAAKKQVDELARQAGVTGDAFSKFFSRNYRLSINDSQLVAANTRLSNLQAKLKEIAASPINVRLNIIEGGLGGGGKQVTRETIQRRFQEATKGGLSGQLTDILAGDIGATRTADLRSALLARLGRGSFVSGGFNVPGLREVITQLGGAPSGAREQLLKQARELVQNVNDSIINKVGQNLLDLKLQLQEGVEGADPPGGDPRLRAEKAQTRLIGLETRLNALQERGVNITRQRNQLARAQASLSEQDFRATALTTQQLENATRLEERAFRVQSAREQQARRSGVGGATTSEQILAGRGGQQKGAALSINAINTALDKQLGLVNRINVLEAKGINVSSSRAKLTQLQAEISNGNLGTANQLLGVLSRQVRTEENALRVANLRAAAAKKLAAAAAATPTAAPTTPATRGGLTARQRRNRDIASNALIGGAFPLLFGQGVGASLGGAVGGAGGGAIGGQFGFGLSLLGTAVGAQFDAIIQKAGTLSKALNDPINSFGEVTQAGLLSSKGLERQVQALIAVGREAEAAALIQQDLANSYGGAEAARALAESQDQLNRSWTQLSVNLGQLALPVFAAAADDAASSLGGLLAILRSIANLRLPEAPPQGPSASTLARGGLRGLAAFAGGGPVGFLGALGGEVSRFFGRNRPTAATSTEATAAAESKRSSLLSNQYKLITAQVQGYKDLALRAERQISLEQEALDIANLRARRAGDPAVDERRRQGSQERFRIDEELRNLERDRARTAQENERRSAEESAKRASALRLISSETEIQAGAIERQLKNAQALAQVEAGILRDALAQRQAIEESTASAVERERALRAELGEAQALGDETAIFRATTQLYLAAGQTKLALIDGARALSDAGRSLKDNILNAQRSIRSTLEGSFDLLQAPVRQQLLEQARGRINFSLFDVGRVRTPSEIFGAAAASESIAAQQQIIAQSSTALVDVNSALVGVVQELNKKKWDVAVNVQGASGYQIIGDVVNATS